MVSLAGDAAIPSYSRDLIQQLDRAYPHKCLAPGQSLEDAHRYAGQRELIDELLALLEEDDELAREASPKDQD